MKNLNIKSTLLVSIFKRKGGEGQYTKIVDDSNKKDYLEQISLLLAGEEPVICCKQDDSNWVLLTNRGVILMKEKQKYAIHYSSLSEIQLDIQTEFKNKVMNKKQFTHLVIKDCLCNCLTINIEDGEPYQGIYQVLNYIASKYSR